jgi:hypothetical protein
MNAYEMQEEAYRVFDRWRAEHDPLGELEILEAATAYVQWAEKNSIAKYLDAAQPSPQVTEAPHD